MWRRRQAEEQFEERHGAVLSPDEVAHELARHAEAARHVAMALIGPSDAEDAVQEALLRGWQAWAKSWTRLTPTFDAEAVEQQWVAPQSGAGAAETVWALIYRDDALTYDGEAYIKDGVYAISRCGLG